MAKASDITLKKIETSSSTIACRQPMKFGDKLVREICIYRVDVTTTVGGGRKKVKGTGEIVLEAAWAWPNKLPNKISHRVLIEASNRLAAKVESLELTGDPLQIMRQVATLRDAVKTEVEVDLNLTEPLTALALMLISGALDAAIHDAFGKANERNSFDCLTAEFLNEDLSAYLGEEFIGKYPGDYLNQKLRATIPVYQFVGPADPLTDADQKTRLDDGHPETLEDWLKSDGISHIKIKLAGNNIDWDVGRIVEVTRICEYVANERNWKLAFDFSENSPDEDYVIDLLERIERLSRLSFDRLQYIEQPTPRDLTQRTEMTVHRISRLRPIVVDEALLDTTTLKLARQRGYTGLAVRVGKGLSEALIMASAAAEYGMYTTVQDVASVGGAFLTTAALASRLPKVAAVEAYGRQVCPAGSEAYMAELAPMFRVRYGTVPTELLDGDGLGFAWKNLP